MWIEDYQWHYDYVRLAWDTGFSFEKCKSPNLDKNKICIVDVDRIVKERDVASVDRYISTVVQYILDDEQAKVLDTNFVKIFRISQLAVEYLLFCKKYLDNTVVLLKKELNKNREENKDLNGFNNELQLHIETLTKQQLFASFKCATCSKVFSSEEYLNAHIKRRHSNQTSETYNSDTEKLNLEIKELKERLNNTEKLLKEKDEARPEKEANNDNVKVNEVLEKFEHFKSDINAELKELRLQKSFYEENYGKLFDIVVQNKENVADNKAQTRSEVAKTETTTQTDKLLRIEQIKDKNVLEIKEADTSKSNNEPSVEKRESLEARMSTNLTRIESQMQTFWDKLNQIELAKPTKEVDDGKVVKPKAKPRSKFNQGNASSNAEKLKIAIEEMEQKLVDDDGALRKKPAEILVVQNKTVEDVAEEEESMSEDKSNELQSDETESSSEVLQVEKENVLKVVQPKAAKHLNKRSVGYESSPKLRQKEDIKHLGTSPNRKKMAANNSKNVIKSKAKLNKEIATSICYQLQQLGISDNWTRLPERSFDKALAIINHQAELSKKSFPNFNSIKKKLNSDIEKKCLEKTEATETKAVTADNKPKLEKLQNIVKLSYRPKSGKKLISQSPKREPIEIKHRSLYDTDTESEQNFKQTKIMVSNPQKRFSSVVDELKSLPKHKSLLINTDEESLDEQKKGVLKSFPSVGSLSKKKVIFDLETDSSKVDEVPVMQKGGGGSTTSIASSILGDKVELEKEAMEERNVEKELDDLSDFDLSDIE